MVERATALFEEGTVVQLVQGVKVIDTMRVISDQRSEITAESLKRFPGEQTQFAFFPNDGWRMLFRGLGGERCFSSRAPSYSFTLAPKEHVSKRSTPKKQEKQKTSRK